ncbi:MAG TPA: hypothetical protein VFW23_04085 [Tepidisphaeraceae bacterium]|nr:hypothetical protein [Tepidisphaeraceae bacterium]
MRTCLLTLVVLSLIQSMSSAAIIYEPVQYQHRGPDGRIYYFGGRHQAAVDAAELRAFAMRNTNPSERPDTFITRTDHVPAVYSDIAPYMNLSVYGYTAVDAANEANASVPRYFRKADLFPAGHLDHHGDWIIPANAKPLPTVHVVVPTTQPAPHAIIIIPKNAPQKQPFDVKSASAGQSSDKA